MGFFDRLFGGNKNRSSEPTSKDLPDIDQSIEAPPEFPYELLMVSGAEAVAKALELRASWRGQFTPVILGPADSGIFSGAIEEDPRSPKDIVEAAQHVDVASRLEERLRENSGEEDDEHLADITNPEDWNKEVQPGDIVSVRDILTSKFHKSVWIAKLPTANAFEVLAYLKFGDWNACPSAQDHVAVWKYWQEKYGAEILCATGDVVEATVARPPKSKEDCYKLAREQFAYCADIVDQGVGSIDALAATLRDGKYWYFWWD